MSQQIDPADQRAEVLSEIRRIMPGNDSATQRNRMLRGMLRLGSVTTYEGSRLLDCYDPRARIYELRLAGYRIKTTMQARVTESGTLHYVGAYALEGSPTYPLFDDLDSEKALE